MSAQALSGFLARSRRAVSVRLTDVRGSSPRETGTEMFVAAKECCGTIGGGQLEYMAIDAARVMLARGDIRRVMDVPLGPEIGQCCGGRVEVVLSRMGWSDRQNALDMAGRQEAEFPHVYIMGAGHVGRALAGFFEALPVRTVVVDTRAEELTQCTALVELRNSAIPEVDIANAPKGSAFIVLTHDHALDFLLTSAALARGDAAYVGMIGSATKRAKFRNWCRDYCDGQSTNALTCPIGALGSADKRPAVIAAFVAAEVMNVLTGTTTKTAPLCGKTLQSAG